MIDQSLVDHVESYIVDGRDLPVNITESMLDAYINLIEQNAELYKLSQSYKSQIASLIHCDDMNTGYEPSLSVFQREIYLAGELINK